MYNALVDEIRNELLKIRAEKGEGYLADVRNTRNIIENILHYLKNSHPRLVEEFFKLNLTERDLRKVIGAEVTAFRRELESAKG